MDWVTLPPITLLAITGYIVEGLTSLRYQCMIYSGDLLF
jgi:hypothetical protein